MPSAFDRIEFAPPPEPALLRGVALALLAHALLMAGLTWGLRWNREEPVVSAEAELWSALPQQAAPRAVAPPPPPPIIQAPPPPPPPAPVVEPKPEPPAPREADIAIEREKERKKLEAERRHAA